MDPVPLIGGVMARTLTRNVGVDTSLPHRPNRLPHRQTPQVMVARIAPSLTGEETNL